jgi:precorrin-4 methylase
MNLFAASMLLISIGLLIYTLTLTGKSFQWESLFQKQQHTIKQQKDIIELQSGNIKAQNEIIEKLKKMSAEGIAFVTKEQSN